MRVLITGICGFVGSTLAKAWMANVPGTSLYGFDNLNRPGSELNRLALQRSGVNLYHGDLRLASDLEQLPKVDWVIDAAAHASVLAGVKAGTSSRQLMEHNLLGTLNLLEYCKRHLCGCILLSTSRVYSTTVLSQLKMEPRGDAFHPVPGQEFPRGFSESGLSEDFSTTPPLSLYGSSKLASELLALEYGNAFGFPVWVNRCGLMAGAGQFGRPDQGIMAYWVNAWRRRRPMTYIGYNGLGHQVRDCLHPRDLLPLLQQQIATQEASLPQIFNIGGGMSNAFSLKELSQRCETRFGSHEIAGENSQRHFDVPWLIMDSSLARTVFGWEPQTSLEQIFDEICQHAEQHPDWLDISGLPEA